MEASPLLILVSCLSIALSQDHRLPTTISPISYNLHLNLSSDVFANDSYNEYTGTVQINITTNNVSTNEIKLHAAHDFIDIDFVSVGDVVVTNYTIDNETDILTLNLGGNFSGLSVLHFQFTSRLSTSDMYGFYKSSYVDGQNVTRYLATTQFQPTYARRAFPCFDEPSFKATFDVYVTYPEEMNVLGNNPTSFYNTTDFGESPTANFKVTNLTSTYLLAFVVSEFTCTDGENVEADLVPYRVCSRNETSELREFAVEIGPKLLRSLNEYTGFNYSQHGFSKMDQVAIPDFAAGAMENWGLVTYRETALLWDENESSNSAKQGIATIISHEFGHMWFGNLVTNQWWSELFLNEGFATFFQYFTTHEVLPEWELDKQFVVRALQAVLVSDASITSQALQHNVSTVAEVWSRFSAISYSKGASVLRMVEHFLGSENFRRGIQNYLNIHQFSNTVPEDLWNALEDSVNITELGLPENLNTIMQNWVQNPGFPLVTVRHVGISLVITQERFLISGNDTTSRWYIPVSYTLSTDENKFQNTTPQAWLEPLGVLEFEISTNVNWIILNNQQTGFFRVNYDDNLWNNISDALLDEDFSGIPDLNRAQLVDDAFNLARVNKMQYSSTFTIIRFLANDTSYYPWYAGLTGFNYLIRRIGLDSELGQAIGGHILELMSNLYESVPITHLNESDHVYTLKQTLTLDWACRLAHEHCTNGTLDMLKEYRVNGTRPHKNLRSHVFCHGLRYTEETSDWDLLWQAYQETDLASERSVLLSALGCTTNTSQLENYLQLSISEDSGIRQQDGLSVFSAVYSSNPVGVDVALKFLLENHEAIAESYQSINALSNALTGLAERFTTQSQIDTLKNFTESEDLPEEFLISANAAIASAEANLAWVALFEDDLREYYGLNDISTNTTVTTPATITSTNATIPTTNATIPTTNATTPTTNATTPSTPPTTLSTTTPAPSTEGDPDDATRVTVSVLFVFLTVFINKLL